jgi:hypothetical protein
MKQFRLALVLGAALGATMAFTATTQAMPAQTGLAADAGNLSAVEQAQFIFGGRNYCFYPDGWHGPGWYWCGYALRRGFGWGGVEGWHGWHRGPGGPGRGGPGRFPHRGPPGMGHPHHHH